MRTSVLRQDQQERKRDWFSFDTIQWVLWNQCFCERVWKYSSDSHWVQDDCTLVVSETADSWL